MEKRHFNLMATQTKLLAAFLFLPLVSYSQPAWLNDSLVAYYKFDGDGKNSSDRSGHDIEYSNIDYGQDRNGESSKSVYLDPDSQMTIPAFEEIPTSNSARTFSMWFRSEGIIPGAPPDVCLLSYGNRDSDANWGEWTMKISVDSPGGWGGLEVGTSMVDGNVVEHWKSGFANIFKSTWNHFVITYDSARATAYLNGETLNWSDDNLKPPINTKSTDITIGSTYWGQHKFTGFIDDLRIYDRHLSADEIAQLYNLESKLEHVVWQRKIDGPVHSSTPLNTGTYNNITGYESKLIVLGSNLNCLNTLTGDIIWVYDEEGDFTSNDHRFNSSMFLENGNVIFSGHDSGEVVMLNGDTGNLIWKKNVNSRIYAPLTSVKKMDGSEDVIVVSEKFITRMDSSRGRIIWNKALSGRDGAEPNHTKGGPIVSLAGHIYFGNWDDGFMTCASAETGEIIWRYDIGIPGRIDNSAAVDRNERVYFTSRNSYLYCVDGYTGDLIWRSESTEFANTSGVILDAQGNPIISAEPALIKFNKENGKILWVYKYDNPTHISTPTLLSTGNILDYSSGALNIHDVQNGTILRSFPFDTGAARTKRSLVSPVVGNKYTYHVETDGTVRAIQTDSVIGYSDWPAFRSNLNQNNREMGIVGGLTAPEQLNAYMNSDRSDLDGDGAPDLLEIKAGSDLDDHNSVPYPKVSKYYYDIPDGALNMTIEIEFGDFRRENHYDIVNSEDYFAIRLGTGDSQWNRVMDIIRTVQGEGLATDGKLRNVRQVGKDIRHTYGITSVEIEITGNTFKTTVNDETQWIGEVSPARLDPYGYIQPTMIEISLLEPSFICTKPKVSIMLSQSTDSDGDGAPDYLEDYFGTSKINQDSDGDGLSDFQEIGLNSTYELILGGVSFDEGAYLAKLRGGHLATITSLAENDLVMAYLKTQSPRGNIVVYNTILGGSDRSNEGEWGWITGEPWLFSDWGDGEPNNAGPFQDEDYLFIANSRFEQIANKWNDTVDYPLPVNAAYRAGAYLIEYGYSSDPLNTDTDNDGLSDTQEFDLSTNPWIETVQINVMQTENGKAFLSNTNGYEDVGSLIEVTAIPEDGFAFLRWAGEIDSSENPLSFKVENSVVLIPIFVEAKPPSITFDPFVGTMVEGQSQTFTVGYEGTAPFQFTWTKDGLPLANATNTLILTNVRADDSGIYSITISNEYGESSVEAVSISVLSLPKIQTQSGNTVLTEGQQLKLAFTFTGSEPVDIQWFKDGSSIEGFKTNALIKNKLSVSDSGIYSFIITNEVGSVSSAPIEIIVNEFVAPPVVTQFVVSPEIALIGSNLILSAAAIGDGPFNFKWYKDDILLTSTELPMFTIQNLTEKDSGEYSVHVSNRASTDVSETVRVLVLPPVSILTSPVDVLVMEKSSFELTVEANGGGNETYNWYFNDQAIEGVSSNVYSVSNATFQNTGQYHVVVSNGLSSVQSTTASVLVTPYIEPPGIIIQPKNKRVHPGDPSSMVVSASGATPLNYQWFLNGEAIFGAVQSFYLIDSVSSDHVGTYTVSITNEAGSVTSNPASLNLIVPLEVLTQSSDVLVTSGDSFQLSVTLNSETIQESYWSKDGNRIEEASGLDYEVLSSSLSDAGNYTFHATDGTDWVQSNVISVTVNQPPVFKSAPEDRSVVDGQRIMLQWIAQGTGKLTYELLLDGQVLDANNSGNFWVTPSGDQGNTEYTVKVSNAFGSITSDPVNVSLEQSNPEIVKQPRNIKLVQGEPLEMMIQASGGALKYQWYKGASQIPEATGATFRIDQTSASDAGDYFVVVSNNKGIVTSKPIKVGFGVKVAVEINGANLVLKMNPGNSQAQWKLQKSSNLLFWQDVQDLTSEDLNGLAKPIGTNTEFYRVVEK